jgi:hypothetical protein
MLSSRQLSCVSGKLDYLTPFSQKNKLAEVDPKVLVSGTRLVTTAATA